MKLYLNVTKIRSDGVCHESFQPSEFASFLGSPHLACVWGLDVLPDEKILKVFEDVRRIIYTLSCICEAKVHYNIELTGFYLGFV